MFELGNRYTLRMLEPDSEGGEIKLMSGMEVTEVKWPLVTFANWSGEQITINTSSSLFESAEQERSEEEKKQFFEEFRAAIEATTKQRRDDLR
jgi:hypothetical protein